MHPRLAVEHQKQRSLSSKIQVCHGKNLYQAVSHGSCQESCGSAFNISDPCYSWICWEEFLPSNVVNRTKTFQRAVMQFTRIRLSQELKG